MDKWKSQLKRNTFSSKVFEANKMPKDKCTIIACQQKISETFNLDILNQWDKKLNHHSHCVISMRGPSFDTYKLKIVFAELKR